MSAMNCESVNLSHNSITSFCSHVVSVFTTGLNWCDQSHRFRPRDMDGGRLVSDCWLLAMT